MIERLQSALQNKTTLHTFLRFCVVGAVTAVVYGGATVFFLNVARLDYRLAISLAYVIGVSFHFVSSRRVTFAAHGEKMGRQLARYCVLLAINYGLTIGVAVLVVDVLGLSHYAAGALSWLVPMLVTFLVLKRWVFAI